MALVVQGATLGHGGRIVATQLDLSLPDRAITALVGPNGSGKSTVLRALARLHPLRAGRVLLDGEDIVSSASRPLARRIALLPQNPTAPPDLLVHELVAFGRFPHRRWHAAPGPEDRQAVAAAIAGVGLQDLADRPLRTLSGGQRQRAWFAMVLAQETGHLLLDEPTSALDLTHQIEVLGLLRRLQAERGLTVVLALHDLNLAARWADHVIVLDRGAVAAAGAPAAVLTPALLAQVYGVQARLLVDPHGGVPVFSPYAICAPDGPQRTP